MDEYTTLSREGQIEYLKDHKLEMQMFNYVFSRNDIDLAKLIKTHGRDLDVNWKYPLDHNTRTALHIACKMGLLNIVEILLEHPDIYVSETDRVGITPFDMAVTSGHRECAQVIWNYLVRELDKKEQFRPNQFRKIVKRRDENDAEFCERVSRIFNLLFIEEESEKASAVPPTKRGDRWMVLRKVPKENESKWEAQEFTYETVSFTGDDEEEIKENIDNVRKIIEFYDY